MNSTTRSRNLDYYFAHDHRRRVFDLTLASALGGIVLLVLRLRETREPIAIGTCILVICITFLVRILIYQPVAMIAPSRRKKTIAPGEYIYRRSLPSRRAVIAEVCVSVFGFALLLLLPKPTIVEVVNRRLRRLLSTGQDQEAAASAQEAIQAGIPLRPDVVRAAGTTETRSFDDLARNVEISSSYSPIPVELDNNAAILIRRPTVYIPTGRYLVRGVVPGLDVSWTGDGPEKSVVVVGNEGSEGFPATVSYSSYRTFDTLITNVGFDTPRHERTGASALQVEPSHGRVVLSNVFLNSVWQKLDNVIWVHVQFRNCAIELGGEQFELAYVGFADCVFKFSDDIPSWIRELIQSDGLRNRLLAFRP